MDATSSESRRAVVRRTERRRSECEWSIGLNGNRKYEWVIYDVCGKYITLLFILVMILFKFHQFHIYRSRLHRALFVSLFLSLSLLIQFALKPHSHNSFQSVHVCVSYYSGIGFCLVPCIWHMLYQDKICTLVKWVCLLQTCMQCSFVTVSIHIILLSSSVTVLHSLAPPSPPPSLSSLSLYFSSCIWILLNCRCRFT